MTSAPDLPGFFVVGAMKAATTSMCDWLDAQPGVAISRPKEPGLFVSDEAAATLLPTLGELFAHAAPGDVRGDGSTDYAKFPVVAGVPERVLRHVPDARIVYMLRHPVERAMSQYRFEWLLQGHSLTFEQALDANPSLVDNGRYAMQLEQWLAHVPRERVLLTFSEAFSVDPEAEVARVLRFLGLPGDDVRPLEQERSNASGDLVRRTRLRGVLRDSRLGRAVRPYLPDALARMYKRDLARRSRPEVTDDLRAQLSSTFDEDLRRLRELTGGPELRCDTWHDVARSWTPTVLAG